MIELPESLKQPKIIATILAICISEEEAEIDRLSAIFKEFGSIQQMRVVRPERTLPPYLQVKIREKNKNIFDLQLCRKKCGKIENCF